MVRGHRADGYVFRGLLQAGVVVAVREHVPRIAGTFTHTRNKHTKVNKKMVVREYARFNSVVVPPSPRRTRIVPSRLRERNTVFKEKLECKNHGNRRVGGYVVHAKPIGIVWPKDKSHAKCREASTRNYSIAVCGPDSAPSRRHVLPRLLVTSRHCAQHTLRAMFSLWHQ